MKIITSELLEMSYDQLVNYYLKKYGKVKYDFFHTPTCVSVQKKNSRTKEGLEIHHIDEDKYHNLSSKAYALKAPFECQKAERLVYVNVLEHLLLHIKICEEENERRIIKGQQASYTNIGEIFLSFRINDYFSKKSFANWHEDMARVIRNNFDDYIMELLYSLTLYSKYHPEKMLAEINGSALKWDGTTNLRVLSALRDKCLNILPIKVGDHIKHSVYGKGVVDKICFFTDSFIVFDVLFENKKITTISSDEEFELLKS